MSPSRASHRSGLRRTRSPMVVVTAAALLGAGCSELPFQAAWDPFAAAPPASATPWRDADGRKQPRLASLIDRLEASVQIDPDRPYGLGDLIDLAQRLNPETRRAWAEARAAAARLGESEGSWFPTLAAVAAAGTSSVVEKVGVGVGGVAVIGPSATPQLELSWLLLDFGRRRARIDEAGWRVLAANLSFNRKHQEIAFAVSRSFFALDARRARLAAARATLEQADAVARAVGARLDLGLATRPDFLLALQDRARAAFEVEEAEGLVADARAALAESVGISPTMRLAVADVSALPLPDGLPASVEHVIDRALARRPDLAARLATLRAREAEVRRARAEFFPRLRLSSSVGGDVGQYTFGGGPTIAYGQPVYSAVLSLDWTLFDGFARDNRLREASARRGAAEAELASFELRVLRQVWQAYTDVKTSLGKREFARALLAASKEAYAATLESYRSAGLATVLDLLAAQRDLAHARFTDIQSRADLLESTAALVFAAGE
jgi:outer membrane protein